METGEGRLRGHQDCPLVRLRLVPQSGRIARGAGGRGERQDPGGRAPQAPSDPPRRHAEARRGEARRAEARRRGEGGQAVVGQLQNDVRCDAARGEPGGAGEAGVAGEGRGQAFHRRRRAPE